MDEDLPLDEVGPWAKEKHERLRKYIDISRPTRRKFVQGPGGATYIDLYCGSGRAIVRDTGEKIDGSPLVAFKSSRDGGVQFSEMHIADASEHLCRAAERRLIRAGGRPSLEVGRAEVTVARIVKRLNPYGLHFAFLDPFNLHNMLKRISMNGIFSIGRVSPRRCQSRCPGTNILTETEAVAHGRRALAIALARRCATVRPWPRGRPLERRSGATPGPAAGPSSACRRSTRRRRPTPGAGRP